VLDIEKSSLGSDNQSTLKTEHNLACVYQDQGRVDDAELLLQQNLRKMETVLDLITLRCF
jgi:hypothetical protein